MDIIFKSFYFDKKKKKMLGVHISLLPVGSIFNKSCFKGNNFKYFIFTFFFSRMFLEFSNFF